MRWGIFLTQQPGHLRRTGLTTLESSIRMRQQWVLESSAPRKRTSCCLLVDKEEIGSVGATGMQSHYLSVQRFDGLKRLCITVSGSKDLQKRGHLL